MSEEKDEEIRVEEEEVVDDPDSAQVEVLEDNLMTSRSSLVNSTELKTSDFITQRVAELDHSLHDLIVDRDEASEV